MVDAKIYGLCLERLKHQIGNAKKRSNGSGAASVILESYNTSDIDDIIDILELYDLAERTQSALTEKLDELAFTASVMMRNEIVFAYDGDGNLGIFLVFETADAQENSKLYATAYRGE